MLKILDQYIIKRYLSTFFFTVMIFSMISVIIDLSEKVDDFIEEDVTITQIIVDYYLNFLVYINSLLIPLYAMISVIFFTSRLAYNSEVISILNAGVSFRRLLLPYLTAAGLITTVHLIGNHYIIPHSNKTRLDFEHTYIWKYSDKGKTDNVHLFLEPGVRAFIQSYQKRDSSAQGFKLERIEGQNLVSVLKAKRAEWIGETQKWRLSNYEVRDFDGMKEYIHIGNAERIDTSINLHPKDFVRYTNHREMMDTPELTSFINSERQRGMGNTKVYEIERHRRTAEPFTVIILTIIGVAVAARKVRGGMGLHLALGVAIGAAYIFLSRFSTVFATNESLTPFFGVWIPNFVFLGLGVYLISVAQK